MRMERRGNRQTRSREEGQHFAWWQISGPSILFRSIEIQMRQNFSDTSHIQDLHCAFLRSLDCGRGLQKCDWMDSLRAPWKLLNIIRKIKESCGGIFSVVLTKRQSSKERKKLTRSIVSCNNYVVLFSRDRFPILFLCITLRLNHYSTIILYTTLYTLVLI